MTTYATGRGGTAFLYHFAASLRAAARSVHRVAMTLDGWLESRYLAAATRQQLSELSDRELRDIGITRADIDQVAKQRTQDACLYRGSLIA